MSLGTWIQDKNNQVSLGNVITRAAATIPTVWMDSMDRARLPRHYAYAIGKLPNFHHVQDNIIMDEDGQQALVKCGQKVFQDYKDSGGLTKQRPLVIHNKMNYDDAGPAVFPGQYIIAIQHGQSRPKRPIKYAVANKDDMPQMSFDHKAQQFYWLLSNEQWEECGVYYVHDQSPVHVNIDLSDIALEHDRLQHDTLLGEALLHDEKSDSVANYIRYAIDACSGKSKWKKIKQTLQLTLKDIEAI